MDCLVYRSYIHLIVEAGDFNSKKEGYTKCSYLKDAILTGDDYQEYSYNVNKTACLVDSLGLTVHPDKSIFTPSQGIEFVSFLINFC